MYMSVLDAGYYSHVGISGKISADNTLRNSYKFIGYIVLNIMNTVVIYKELSK